jgi:Flp pilus assembly protein CpaB
MKWSIFGLFSLGLLAAVAATVLVVSLRSSLAPRSVRTEAAPAPPEPAVLPVPVLVSAADLPPRTVIGSEHVRVHDVLPDAAPESAFVDAVQVVGRVLIQPVKEGQAFLPGCFASQGSGLHLASTLGPGQRAVGITLSDEMGIEELLYPGCLVDVLAKIDVEEPDLGEEPISVTLLEGVLVLAVGEHTIVAPEEGELEGRGSGNRRPIVTLLLEPPQAESLKLAMAEGSISLVLRNPMDEGTSAREGTRLAMLSPILAAVERLERERAALAREEAERVKARQQEVEGYDLEEERFGIERARKEMEIAREKLALEMYEAEQTALDRMIPRWETVIVRGGEVEKKVFVRPAGDGR